ncbi:hypothetical protein CYY_008488 [Polysphondylium violaceum]|uniref:Nucleoporin n=1 Tax=Polysphondylium violaceum TaxID=133409 RepID=A0A8J4UX95_9MYCE|nr:hypothetical protein CYY_008488 [Polysphondylium violaceum]
MNRNPQLYPSIGGYQQQQQQQQQQKRTADQLGASSYSYLQSPSATPLHTTSNVRNPVATPLSYSVYQQQDAADKVGATPTVSINQQQQQQQQAQQPHNPFQQQQQLLQQQQQQQYQQFQQSLHQSQLGGGLQQQQQPLQQQQTSPNELQSTTIAKDDSNKENQMDKELELSMKYDSSNPESLLSMTSFDKEADLKAIYSNSLTYVEGSINKIASLPDPTLKNINKKDPGFNYFEPPNNSPTWSTLVIEKHIEFPIEITQRYLTTSTKTLLGLFPEIGRAWISIDQTLYLWDYRDSGELISHNLSQIITNCALVNPKRNTFKDTVKKIMVVCTHVEVFLYALCFSSEVQFELLSSLSIPTDNVFITDIVGTRDGRIFLSGQDGNVYEIEYSKDNIGWFSNDKIKKVNRTFKFMESIWASKKPDIIQMIIDEDRNLLYTLTKDSAVSIYNLGRNGDKFEYERTIHLISEYDNQLSYSYQPMNQQQQQQGQQQMYYNQGGQQPPQQRRANVSGNVILSINVSPKETEFYFIAIISNGDRLYYSTNNKLYIRNPPNTPHVPNESQIHYTYYSNGVFFTASEISEHEDKLVGTTLFGNDYLKSHFETYPQNSYSNQISQDTLSEKSNLFSIRGRISVIKEDITSSSNRSVYYKELANEHSSVPRRFLCLNSLGLHFITKLRYVDILQNILISNNLTDIDNFFEAFGKILTSSLCISLYCSSPHSSILLNNQSYGPTTVPRTTSTRIADLAMTHLKRKSGRPCYHQQTQQYLNDMGAAVHRTEIMYSNAYNGLLAYLGRIYYPFWNRSIIVANGSCYWSTNQLKLFQSHLSNLLSFCEISQLIPKKDSDIPIKSNPMKQGGGNASLYNDEIAAREEKRNLIGFKNVIVKSVQVISLFLILSQYNFKQVYEDSSIPLDTKKRIESIKFSDLISDGSLYSVPEIATHLIDSLMKNLNNLNISIDQVSQQLESECPLFFKKKHRDLYKAKEKLNVVLRDGGSNYFTETYIKDAVQILFSICPDFDLHEITDLLIRLKLYQYITPLAIQYGTQIDPHGVTAKPTSSPSGEYKSKYSLKKKAYQEIVDFLQLIETSAAAPDDHPNYCPREFIDIVIQQVVQQSQDFICHNMLYTWLLDNDYSTKLSELTTPFIVEFLLEHNMELCWKLLAKNADLVRASAVLFQIAEKSNNLDDKIAAYTNCVVILCEQKDSEAFIYSKSQIKLANIQKQIIKSLELMLSANNDAGLSGEEREDIKLSISNLSKNIFDITTLFKDYARKYLLHEQMLYLCHIGNHNDQNFIKILWKIIIDKEVPAITNNNANDQMSVQGVIECLKSKISNIGYDLYPNEITFPVQYIIQLAEKSIFNYSIDCFEQVLDFNWLVSSLYDHVKIDYLILVEYYKSVIENQINSKESDDETLYLVNVYCQLIESVINTIHTPTERRLFSSKQILSSLDQFSDKVKFIQQKYKNNSNHNLLYLNTCLNIQKSIDKIHSITQYSSSSSSSK